MQSTLSVGSTFHIVVPYESTQDASKIQVTEKVGLRSTTTKEGALQVLIADADPVNQSVAAHFLQKQGHATTTARDYESALRALREKHIDVALIDLQLPGLEGLDFVRRIRNNEEQEINSQLPIVGVASMAFYEDLRTALKAGINAVVSKPYQSASLIKAINRSLGAPLAAQQKA